MPITYEDLDSVCFSADSTSEEILEHKTKQMKFMLSSLYGIGGTSMGNVKEAMLEHRMVSANKKTGSQASQSLDRITGANYHLSRKHWAEEIRNSMYQLNDAELVAFLKVNQVEQERLRVCLQIAQDEERQESEASEA